MKSPRYPLGPPLGAINEDALTDFKLRLSTAHYRRGPCSPNRPLSEMSQLRTLQELRIVLDSTGPAARGMVRAGILDNPPAIFIPEPASWPKPTWTMEEARSIVGAIGRAVASQQGFVVRNGKRRRLHSPANQGQWRQLFRSTIALWFYTGHRATVYGGLCWSDLVEAQPGRFYLQVIAPKTAKRDRLAVNPRLLTELRALQKYAAAGEAMFTWPVNYRELVRKMERLQAIAGLPASRRFSPQAWRRLHAEQIAQLGFALAESLASTALGHSSAAVTAAHYASARDAALLRLPDLFA